MDIRSNMPRTAEMKDPTSATEKVKIKIKVKIKHSSNVDLSVKSLMNNQVKELANKADSAIQKDMASIDNGFKPSSQALEKNLSFPHGVAGMMRPQEPQPMPWENEASKN